MEEGETGSHPDQREIVDKRLDFASPEFDPALALQTPDLQPPVPDAPVLDNVSKCAALLQTDAPQLRAGSAASLSEDERIKQQQEQQARKAKAAALKQRAQKAAQRAEASVRTQSLANIMASAAKGPLAVLAKWQASGQKVHVITRHAAGVRGKAVGVIKAFDRFMNLVLADVEESYTVVVKVPRVKQQHVQAKPPDTPALSGTSIQQLQQQQLVTPQQQLLTAQQQIAGIMGVQLPGQAPQQQQQPSASQQQLHTAHIQQQQQQQHVQGQQYIAEIMGVQLPEQPEPQQQQSTAHQQQSHTADIQQQQQQVLSQQHIAEEVDIRLPDIQQLQQQQAHTALQPQPGTADTQQLQQQQPDTQQNPTTRTRVRWCRKQEHRFRRLDQVLLRGDSIVLISSQLPVAGLPRPPADG